MPNPLVLPILNWARKLKHPVLFKVTGALFLLTLLLPDPVLFLDEIVLGLATIVLGNMTRRREDAPPPIDGNAARR